MTWHTSMELPKKLDDEFLGSVTGGVDFVDVTAGLACPLILTSFACLIASCVYFSKVNHAKKDSEIVNKHNLSKSKNCAIAATTLLGAGILSTVVAATGAELQKKYSK